MEFGFVWLNTAYHPRKKYDGINWYVTVGVECGDSVSVPSGEGIGIDLGIKDFAAYSDWDIYQNITRKIKKLEKNAGYSVP